MSLLNKLVIHVLFCPLVLCAKTAITVEELGPLLEFSGKIVVSDKTQELSAKYGDVIVSALLFKPDDEGFSRIQALITKGGFLLSDERRRKLGGAGPAVRRIQLANGTEGYIGLEGAGPGGEGYVALAHIPDKDLDIQFKIIISSDGAIRDSSDEIAKFHGILRDNFSLKKLLDALLAQGVANVAEWHDENAGFQAEQSLRIETIAKVAEPSAAGKQIETPAAVMVEPAPKPRVIMWWSMGMGGTLVAVLVMLLKKKKV